LNGVLKVDFIDEFPDEDYMTKEFKCGNHKCEEGETE